MAATSIRYKPHAKRRRSIRLRSYDYSRSGAYFVTMCAQDRACLFGEVVDGMLQLNDAGRMVQAVWEDIPTQYAGVEVDAFVVMPNHLHGILVLVGAGPRACPGSDYAGPIGQLRGAAPTRQQTMPLSLPDVVQRFKTTTTRLYIEGVRQLGWPPFRGRLWQRNYFEHVLRGEESLKRLRQYIDGNPSRWLLDPENPSAADSEKPPWLF